MINNLHKNAGHLMFLLLSFLFFQLSGLSQSPVPYTVDQSTTGDSLITAFGLPNGKSGVLNFNVVNHNVFCTIINPNGTVANNFDITSKLTPQDTYIRRLQFNAVSTPNGNIFITYTAEGTDNLNNPNALYLVLDQSGAKVASGNVNTSNGGPGVTLNRYMDLVALSNGNVVATWETYTQGANQQPTASSGSGIFRIFNQSGVAVTNEIVYAGPASSIFTSILNNFGSKVAANSGDGFLISFDYNNNSGDFRAIRFNNSGVVQPTNGVNTFAVDGTVATNYKNLSAAGLSNGNYMLFWKRGKTAYYKVIDANGADVKPITTPPNNMIVFSANVNDWLDGVAVNTGGRQGFALATNFYRSYTDYSNPDVRVHIYNYDLTGNFLDTAILTSYYIGDPAPKPSLYSGLPSGVGVAYQSYKTYTPFPNASNPQQGYFTVPADIDVQGATLDFDLPTVISITRKTPTTLTTNATSVTYQVVFSTSVTGVDASDFSLSPTGDVTGTIGTVSGSGTTYTVPVSSITGSGILRLDLKSSGTGIKSGGNTDIFAGFTSGETFQFDHIVPTLNPVTITSNNTTNTAYAKIGDKVTVSFTASETLNTPSVTATIAGQTATITNTGGNNWKAERTMTGSETLGLVTFSIFFSDAAGNAGTAVTAVTAGGGSVIFDKTAPSVTSLVRQSPTAQTTNATMVTYRITFSEAVTGVSITDFTLATVGTVSGTIGMVTAVASSSGTQYDVQVNSLSGDGTLGLNLNSSGTGIIDVAGNASGGYTTGETYNRVGAPTVTGITRLSPLNQLTNATSVIYQVVFSSPVTGVDASDFGLFSAESVSGTIGTVSGSGDTYSVPVNSITGNGFLRLDLNSSGTGIKDDNNTGILTGFTSGQTYQFDHIVPTLNPVTIFSNNPTNRSYAKVNDKVTVDFTASEPLQTATVTIFGQTVAATNSGGNEWTADYSPQSSDAPEGPISFSIDFSDPAGNGGITVTQTTDNSDVTFDKTMPAVSSLVRFDPTNQTTSATAVTFRITFSEAVSGVDVNDFILTGPVTGTKGTVTAVSGSNGTQYDIPVSNLSGTGTLGVDLKSSGAGIVDAAGNTSAGFTTGETYIRVNAPTVTSITRFSPGTQLTNLTAVTYQVVFSVNVMGVDKTDFSLFSSDGVTGTIGPVSGSGTTYTVPVTGITGNGDLRLDAKSSGTGIQDDNNIDIDGGFTSGQTYTFDHTDPTLTTVTIASNNVNTALAKVGDVVTVNFTASEAIGTPTAAIATNTATVTSLGGNSYNATYTMTSTDAEGTIPFSISFNDQAGNSGAAVSNTIGNSKVTFDRTAPYVVSSNRQNPLTQAVSASPLVYRVTFSEDVTGVNTANFALNISGSAGTTSISTVSAISASVYDVTVTVGSFTGAGVRLDLNGSATGIKDAASNTIVTGFTSGQTYILGVPPAFTTCATTKSFNVDAGLCTANATRATLISGLVYTGAPTPTLTVKVGTTTVTSSYNFPVGNTTVNVIASNGVSDDAICQYTVTVSDNQPPALSTPAATPAALWPANHKMQTVTIDYTANDLCGAVTTAITNVSSNEPVNGTADGDTSPDWIIDPNDPHHVQLRAEKANNGSGRIYTVTVTAKDASGNISTKTVNVYVAHNISTPITGTAFKSGSTVSFAGAFQDKAGSKHAAQWLIDGSTTTNGTVAEPSGTKNGTVSGSYKFSSPGVYKLQINVTDQNKVVSYANTNNDMEEIVVVYDPTGGYTYGGGWFTSPAGAITANPSATGKVNYGFQTNYYKGATNPKGETQFEFKVGNLEFNALNFDYLSVSGAKAQFKGSGKITGDQSGYSFIMTVIDGQLIGSGTDKIRMKIYNKNTGAVIYDSQPGASDAADPTAVVGSGSTIVIAGSNPTILPRIVTTNEPSATKAERLSVTVYPNPSPQFFTLVPKSGSDKSLNVRVTDVWGRVVETRGSAAANGNIMIGHAYRPGTYFAEVLQGSERVVVKLIKQSN